MQVVVQMLVQMQQLEVIKMKKLSLIAPAIAAVLFVTALLIAGCSSKITTTSSDQNEQSQVSQEVSEIDQLTSETSLSESENFEEDLTEFENFGE